MHKVNARSLISLLRTFLEKMTRGQQSKCPNCGVKRMDPPQNTIGLGGKKLSLFLGYVDKSVLKNLNFNDKVIYLRERAKLVFLDSLEEVFYLESEKALAKFHLLTKVLHFLDP